MTIVTTVRSVLAADATLAAIATGGVYDWNSAGRDGIVRTSTPAAFGSNGRIKPFIMVTSSGGAPDGVLVDEAAQYVSYQAIIGVWMYQDTGYEVIESMRNRVYTLLHAKQIPGIFRMFLQFDMRGQRDPGLDASVERSDFVVRMKREPVVLIEEEE